MLIKYHLTNLLHKITYISINLKSAISNYIPMDIRRCNHLCHTLYVRYVNKGGLKNTLMIFKWLHNAFGDLTHISQNCFTSKGTMVWLAGAIEWILNDTGGWIAWIQRESPSEKSSKLRGYIQSNAMFIWTLWHQEHVSQAWINICIPYYSVECNYLSLSKIPASATNVLIWWP